MVVLQTLTSTKNKNWRTWKQQQREQRQLNLTEAFNKMKCFCTWKRHWDKHNMSASSQLFWKPSHTITTEQM